jgi:signal transduction histidine kinase
MSVGMESESSAVRVIADHLSRALDQGGSGVFVGKPTTIAAVGEDLDGRGLPVDNLVREGRLVILDAECALAAMQLDTAIDPYRFSATIESTLRCMIERAHGRPVHAVSELGTLITSTAARTRLDQLWRTACHELGVVTAHDDTAPMAPTGRMQKLLELGNDLAAALTRDEVVARTLAQGLRAVDAAAISVWGVAGDQLEPLGVSAVYTQLMASPLPIPIAGDAPLCAAVRTAEGVFLRCAEVYRASFPASYQRMQAHSPFDEIAIAALPLIGSTGRVLGGVVFTYRGHRELSAAERAFLAILARQTTLALERLDAYEHERRVRYETELLNRLIATLNGSDSANEVFELALDTIEHGARCDRSAILLFDGSGVMRFRAQHGLSASYRAAVEGHSPWTIDTIDPVAVTVDDTELDPAWAGYRDVFRAERIRAIAFIPLVHRHKVVGKVMLYRAEPRSFTPRELELATTAAHHVALAVERTAAQHALARAFSVERAAHLEAADATRAREEIISVVSHDLRSPLAAILAGASTIVELAIDHPRLPTIGHRIQRQAERMARLVDDLVDYAAIQSGRVALSRALHPAETIVEAATDMFAAIATEQGLHFESNLPPGLPVIECDSERALQVMANLVANALKVTPRGGRIAIGAKPRTGREAVVFYVKDTGPGIAVEDQPRLFERFWRGKSATYKGSGLGLSIARGIVSAHGGRIWVESDVGEGTTFYFSLSSAPST